MKVIGLTGGIGSGKSLVAKILQEKYGAYILNTDGIAKEQMEPGGASYQEVVDYFGQEILLEDGSINRNKLAVIVFKDKEKRHKINEITHPKVLASVKEEIQLIKNKEEVSYLVVETALMIEAGYDYICDEVWYVHTPEEERRSRLKKERNYSDEKINSIFENQSRAEAFRAKFPKVIENIGDISMLEQQVDKLLIN
ncbi:MAG: dephospho-CoA kinase [Herbinix sp.]|nr:dephospho-CoA kinase [Herbinix sp.]